MPVRLAVNKWTQATLALAILVLPAAAQAAKPKKTNVAAMALFRKALALSDIEAPGGQAFRMQARLQVFGARGDGQDGNLLRIWTPVGLRHDEIVLPDFQRVEVANGKDQWSSSTADHLPFLVFQAEQVLSLAGQLRAGMQMDLQSSAVSAEEGQECVHGAGNGNAFEFCFDTATGELLRVVNGLWNDTYDYSDYQAWGTKSFPRLLRVLKSNGETLVEIHVDQLAAESTPDLNIFLPGKGAKEGPDPDGCGNIDAARAVKVVKPAYPQDALRAGISGTVRLYADIGADGIPRGLSPLNAPSAILADAAIGAVSQWRYRPMVCHRTGAPIEAPTTITVTFASR
jgi:TonB family protein